MRRSAYFHRGARIPGQRRPVTTTELESLTPPAIRRATGVAARMPLSDELQNVGPRELAAKLRMPQWGRRR